ncbi:acyltransferase family protein [Streptococcus ovis]|uniref:acyltransferase family protein n=1 Tax=Streptococcus ovis TaxID=82806 RepID=UPI0003652003|nr:acyltransferase family protein [Streptococcus ovis]
MKIKWFSFIRVIGLLWVLLYHFFVKFFPGGFLGVDVFFTFSGYLITALLIDEYTRRQSIDLAGFFRRRFYRIFPPLTLTILVTMPLALFVRNDFIANIGHQITAALGFVTNYFEILAGSSYENQFTPHLFVHTWSLAIEVHFYILWALAVWYMAKVSKSIGQLRGLIFLSSGAIALASFLSMFISSFFVEEFSRIYFSSWTHIFPFFIGASLSTLVGIQNTTNAFKRISSHVELKKVFIAVASALAVLTFLLLFLNFNSIWTYLVGFLLSSIATAVLIYCSRILHERFSDRQEPAFITYLSDISYSVYLFHWPLYIIFNQLFGNTISVILTTILSILLATFSFYILEPYLSGKEGHFAGRTISLAPYQTGLIAITSLLTLATIGISFFAPKVGAFETDLLVNGLRQADTRMQQTYTFAEKGKASAYEIAEGVNIIGDSVTLRATPQLQAALPDALIDAQGSRNTQQAYELLKTNIENGTLLKDVVIATGVNIIYNYEEELNKIIEDLPNGHHLILLTPYDGNSAQYDDPVAEKHAQYVYKLADKYDFIAIADWNRIAKANPQIWTGSDYIHFGFDQDTTAEGGTLYTQAIQEALEMVKDKPVKNEGKDQKTTSE